MWRLSCARICQLFSNRWTRECTLENVFYCCCFYRPFSVHTITEPWLFHELLRCTSFSWILICGPFSPVKPWVKSRSDCRAHTLIQLLQGGGVAKRSLPQASSPYLAFAMFSLSCVYDLHKTWHSALSPRCHAVTATKCTKKRDSRAKLLFY